MRLGLVMEGDASLPLLKVHRQNRWLKWGRVASAHRYVATAAPAASRGMAGLFWVPLSN